MKKFLFAVIALLSIGLSVKAQTTLNNRTGCPVIVYIDCFDPVTCAHVGQAIYPLPGGASIVVPECGTNIPVFTVCWQNPCGPNSCVRVARPHPCFSYPAADGLMSACPGCTTGAFGPNTAWVEAVNNNYLDIIP